MFAGLTYLDKLGDKGEDTQYDPTWRDDYDLGLKEGMLPSDITHPNFEELEAQCVEEGNRTNAIKRAWLGLRGLRRGLEDQHERLKSIAFEENASTKLQKLLRTYSSPKKMGEMGYFGIQRCSRLCCSGYPCRGCRIHFSFLCYFKSSTPTRPDRRNRHSFWLAALGGCLSNEDDREDFALLALRMWPREHLRTTDDIGKRSGQDDDKDSHCLRVKRSRLENSTPSQPVNLQPFQNSGGQDSSSKEIREAALSTSHGLEMLSEGILTLTSAYGQQHPFDIGNLEVDVINISDQTSEEYDFSHFLSLLGDPGGTLGEPGQHNDTVSASGVDPKSRECYWSGLSLDQIPSQTFLPMNDPHIRPPVAKDCPCIGTDNPAVKRNIIKFKCFNRDSDTAIFKLRDTPMFLVVVAFAQDTGDVFYRLSGCGKTVHAIRRSSAYARERSKAERRLRRDLFNPMKNSGESNVVFLALLAVAKSFVILGSLGTLEHAQDYLVAISRVRLNFEVQHFPLKPT